MNRPSIREQIHEANKQILVLKKALSEVIKKGSYEEERALWSRYHRLQDMLHQLVQKYLERRH